MPEQDASEQGASEQGALVTETQFSESEILYVKHIQSILLEKCLGCHGVGDGTSKEVLMFVRCNL